MKTRSPYVSQAFKPSAWLANIDFIKQLVMSRHLLLAVVADAKGGKSTFIDLLRLKLEPAIQTVLFHGDQHFSIAAFIDEMANLFNVELTAEKSLNALFQAIEPRTTPVILIIEDAQVLPRSFLDELIKAYKAYGNEAHLHVCLTADFNFIPVLKQLGEDSFIHTIEPGILTESEMKTYVLKLLQGKVDLKQFVTPERLQTFYQLTGGQVAKINRKLQAFFIPEPKQGKVQALLIKQAWLFVFMTGMIISFASGWYFSHTSQKTEAILNQASSQLASQIPGWHVDVKIQSTEPSPMQKFVTLPEEEDESKVLLDKVVVIPEFVNEPEPYLVSELISIPEKPIQEAHLPIYTIQLLASPHLNDLHRFIQTHHLDLKIVSIREFVQKDQRWYVLTLGEYAAASDAQQAIKALPVAINQLKPWVRQVESLKRVG